jgi:hypothetical protein
MKRQGVHVLKMQHAHVHDQKSAVFLATCLKKKKKEEKKVRFYK